MFISKCLRYITQILEDKVLKMAI